jgi:heat-inducible transcriptional repressor
VPSDFGYRQYVDNLLNPSQAIAQQVDHQLSEMLDWDGWSIEALLRGAAQILATLSGYLTLISMPQRRSVTIRHLQVVWLGESQMLLTVILESLETQSIVIQFSLDETLDQRQTEALEQELKILSNFLKAHLMGKPLQEVETLNWSEIDREFQRYGDTLKGAIKVLAKRAQPPITNQFVVSGLGEVLRQPEFSEAQQVQAIVQLLEAQPAQLWPLVFETAGEELQGQRVRVLIGSENPLEPMQGCSLVSSTYSDGIVPIGSVSVLGPTRMMYDHAIAAVEAAASYLSEAFRSSLEAPTTCSMGLERLI